VESLRLTSDDLRRLVLEAVAYGSLLNDSEKQFDSIYELTPASNRIMGVLTGDEEGAKWGRRAVRPGRAGRGRKCLVQAFVQPLSLFVRPLFTSIDLTLES
ncbi:Uncharacterized protein SCF082_LOCUS5549, partial [Durusdinium trenchii]